jgi:hypothetical protein
MKNSITIRSLLRKGNVYESQRRVTVRGPMKVVTTLTSCFGEESIGDEGSTGGEDGTSSIKEEYGTSEESSFEEDGAFNKRAPRRL